MNKFSWLILYEEGIRHAEATITGRVSLSTPGREEGGCAPFRITPHILYVSVSRLTDLCMYISHFPKSPLVSQTYISLLPDIPYSEKFHEKIFTKASKFKFSRKSFGMCTFALNICISIGLYTKAKCSQGILSRIAVYPQNSQHFSPMQFPTIWYGSRLPDIRLSPPNSTPNFPQKH